MVFLMRYLGGIGSIVLAIMALFLMLSGAHMSADATTVFQQIEGDVEMGFGFLAISVIWTGSRIILAVQDGNKSQEHSL